MKTFFKWFFLIVFLLVVIVVATLIHVNKVANIISTGDRISENDIVQPALLVIDIQEATTGKVSITQEYIHQSGSLIKTINRLLKYSENENIPVIYIYSEINNWLINLLNSTMKKGTIGTQIDTRLLIISDYILPKEKSDSFSNPRLDEILMKNKINRLYITGLDAAFCVKNTIAAAQNRGYDVVVIEDALLSKTTDLKTEMIDYFRTTGVSVITSQEYFLK